MAERKTIQKMKAGELLAWERALTGRYRHCCRLLLAHGPAEPTFYGSHTVDDGGKSRLLAGVTVDKMVADGVAERKGESILLSEFGAYVVAKILTRGKEADDGR